MGLKEEKVERRINDPELTHISLQGPSSNTGAGKVPRVVGETRRR